MKIDDVELTLFSWDDIPPTRYTPGSQNVTGRSNLGLLRIATDDGIEGHALLGSAINPAETDAGALIRFLKPVLMGKDPLAREDLHAAMRRVSAARDCASSAPATLRCGISVPRRPACRSTSFSAADARRLAPMRRARCSKTRRLMRKKLPGSRPTAGKATRFTLRRAR